MNEKNIKNEKNLSEEMDFNLENCRKCAFYEECEVRLYKEEREESLSLSCEECGEEDWEEIEGVVGYRCRNCGYEIRWDD